MKETGVSLERSGERERIRTQEIKGPWVSQRHTTQSPWIGMRFSVNNSSYFIVVSDDLFVQSVVFLLTLTTPVTPDPWSSLLQSGLLHMLFPLWRKENTVCQMKPSLFSIQVSAQTWTHWGSSQATVKVKFLPPSLPGTPGLFPCSIFLHNLLNVYIIYSSYCLISPPHRTETPRMRGTVATAPGNAWHRYRLHINTGWMSCEWSLLEEPGNKHNRNHPVRSEQNEAKPGEYSTAWLQDRWHLG